MQTTQPKRSLKSVLLKIEKNNNIDDLISSQIVFFINALTAQKNALNRKTKRLELSIENLLASLKKKSTSQIHYYKIVITNNNLKGTYAKLCRFYMEINRLDKIIHELYKIQGVDYTQ